MKVTRTRTTLPAFGYRSWALTMFLLLPSCYTPNGWSVVDDNDVFGFGKSSDRNYTQGLRLSLHYRPETFPSSARAVLDKVNGWNLFSSAPSGKQKLRFITGERFTTGEDDDRWLQSYGMFVGQSMFTPTKLNIPTLQESDRPYAGWLYAGIERASLFAGKADDWGNDQEEVVRVTFGLTGKNSFAEETQSEFHRLIGTDTAKGWAHQLDEEVTIMASFAKRYNLFSIRNRTSKENSERWELGPFGMDGSVFWSPTVGTPFTNVAAGSGFRVGWGMPRFSWIEAGPGDNSRALGGRLYGEWDKKNKVRFYFFAGVSGSAVLYNTFLDGNLDGESHSVSKRVFVGEAQGGLAFHVGRAFLTFIISARSQEFDDVGGGHRIGSVFGGYSLDF